MKRREWNGGRDEESQPRLLAFPDGGRARRLHGAAEGRDKGGQDVGGVQMGAATGCRRGLHGVRRRDRRMTVEIF